MFLSERDWIGHIGLMRLMMTNYLDVISSWCYWAIPAWQELQERYRDSVDFRWKIALMDKAALPPTREQTEWYYRRSGMLMRSPVMLNASWVEPDATEYLAPNCTAEAARDFGVEDDRVWLALIKAELLDGQKIAGWELSGEIAAATAGVNATRLMERARSPDAEFHALQVTQRPTFVIDSPIGDRAVFSGFAKAAPMAATIDAMLDDIAGYRAHAAHFGELPR